MSSQCSNIPVELVLATTDPKLYDAETNTWLWNGQMYWAVECLSHHQRTVSDRVVPNIKPENYLPLDHSPSQWDYCRSQNCGAGSDSMQIIFTFNPHSTDPNDFLQYVIDIHCQVTDSPRHDIKDTKGNSFYLDIVEISGMTKEAYVEVWIDRTHEDKKLTVAALEAEHSMFKTALAITTDQSPTQSSSSDIIIIIVLVIVLLLALVVGGIVFIKYRKSTAPSNIPQTVGFGNIQ